MARRIFSNKIQIVKRKQKTKTKRGAKFWLKIIGSFCGGGFLIIIGIFIFFASKTPNIEDFKSGIIEESTIIYDRNGVELYEISGDIRRRWISLDEVSPYLKNATIAVEDANFYKHPGIDFKGIIRAVIVNLASKGERVQGGSTITQQLIKNMMFLQRDKTGKIIGPAPRTFTRKIQEAIFALEIERKYSKDEILELYLNYISYGSMSGSESASLAYFNKSAKDLNLTEAVILASLPQRPSYYLKPENKDKLLQRRNYFLDRMAELNYTTKEETESAKKEALKIEEPGVPIRAPHFSLYVKDILIEEFGENYVNQGGLKVYTTLDWNLQKLAEEIIKEEMPSVERRFQAANATLVTINPQNGEILAMVGSRDYFSKRNDGKMDPKVNVALRRRSPGSALKPIVYATAFKKGYTPDTILWDAPTNFNPGGKSWQPNNYDRKFRGPLTMKDALAQSLNIPSVKTLYLAGVDSSIALANQMGVSFSKSSDYYGLSLVLGGGEIKPLELTSAYGTFATRGIHYPHNAILKILDRDGDIIQEYSSNPKKVLDEIVADEINWILSNNNLRAPMFGFHSSLNIGPHVAVKTGTSEDWKDTWMIGYSKKIVVGVWVGNSDGSPIRGIGAETTGNIWSRLIKEAIKNDKKEPFIKPRWKLSGKPIIDGKMSVVKIKVDKISGKLATELTPEELIVEKNFIEPHSILYYVNRLNPLGPQPKNPATDPQFYNWEAGVQYFIKKFPNIPLRGFALPPSEEDDIHTSENQPKIESILPKENSQIDKSFILQIKVKVPLGLEKISIFLENESKPRGEITKENKDKIYSFSIQNLPSSKNYKLKIVVYDKAKNKIEKIISYLGNAEPEPTPTPSPSETPSPLPSENGEKENEENGGKVEPTP